MTITLLRSVGQNLRPVGPLTVANGLQNPSFELPSLNSPVAQWTTLNNAACVVSNTYSKFDGYSAKITITNTVTGLGAVKHGIEQTLAVNVDQESDYLLSTYVKIPTALALGLWADVELLDGGLNTLSTQSGLLLSGAVTDWARVSLLASTVIGTAFAKVRFYITANTNLTTFAPFYLDGAMWSKGSGLGPYVDGDYSGYVWADTRDSSVTLLSAQPGQLRSFIAAPYVPVTD